MDSAQGSEDGWENRRVYPGAEALFFRQLKLHAQIKTSGVVYGILGTALVQAVGAGIGFLIGVFIGPTVLAVDYRLVSEGFSARPAAATQGGD